MGCACGAREGNKAKFGTLNSRIRKPEIDHERAREAFSAALCYVMFVSIILIREFVIRNFKKITDVEITSWTLDVGR